MSADIPPSGRSRYGRRARGDSPDQPTAPETPRSPAESGAFESSGSPEGRESSKEPGAPGAPEGDLSAWLQEAPASPASPPAVEVPASPVAAPAAPAPLPASDLADWLEPAGDGPEGLGWPVEFTDSPEEEFEPAEVRPRSRPEDWLREADLPETDRSGEAAPTPRPTAPFRAEIHGLRALAILLVAVYHIWFGRVSGGVDVFLFISAFLLTGTFVRRMEAGRQLSVPHYWLRTFKRLLPPAVVVILAVLAMAWWLLPATGWATVQRHALASLLYVQNYVLAADSVDYYAHDAAAASPLQHFWSMSVQGQIFLLWPLLFALGALWLRLRRGRGRPRRVMLVIFGLIGAGSLAWSIASTAADQSFAYFDTGARLWEFAAGSVLALVLPRLDRRRAARSDGRRGVGMTLLGWVGLLALVACGALLDVQGLFPGWIALWPLTAAALVILVGGTGRAWGTDRVLSWAPLSFLGSIAYALYLVHWPLLIGWLAVSGRERAGLADGLAVLAAAIVLAWLLTRLVDTPVRRSTRLNTRPGWALSAVAASLAVGILASQVAFPALTSRALQGAGTTTATETTAAPAHPGATWTGDPLTAGTGAPIPAPDDIVTPESGMPTDCSGSFAPTEYVSCLASMPADGEAETTVLLAGDSHAAQYTSAAMAVAEQNDWAVYYVGRSGCSIVTSEESVRCARVNDAWEDALAEIAPDVVVTLGTHSTPTGTEEAVTDADHGVLPAAREADIPVVLLRDNPRWPEDASRYDCAVAAMRSGGDATSADLECGADIGDKLAAGDPLTDLASEDPEAPVLVADPSTEVLCPAGRCSPVIGNVIVYRDDDHLTADFSATMGPWLAEQVDAALTLSAA